MTSLFNNNFLKFGHVAIKSLRQASLKLHTAGPLQQQAAATSIQLDKLQPKLQEYINEKVALCQPDNVHVCDGSEAENKMLLALMEREGTIKKLTKHDNNWLAITDPKDVARVESKTFISTPEERETAPIMKEGVKRSTGNWISQSDLEAKYAERFPGCMKGRTMYVIPFSMGPVGSPLAKYGIELTDSAYVVANMRIMTRMGAHVLEALGDGEFVKCLHSVGQPLPMKTPPVNNWPCNPDKTIITHIPHRKEICSYGSGYGGNSLLGKKCFALRIASTLARDEGWLAEHMLILGLTNPEGVKRYVVAAFPSACGKTNLAMLEPSLPGWKAECIGDDIAWMRFDKSGRLRAINPEYGYFGVAPGTSYETNPNAMECIQKNTIFTNVGERSDGSFYWEGMEDELPKGVSIRSYQGVENWNENSQFEGKKALSAHPNSRFCAPAQQCPVIDPAWEDPEGVPIDAIIFGGRRPEGVPLVYESFDWQHGVFVGAAVKSEATAAAEFKQKVVMHDPFAMRPFFGYNIGHYIQHWLDFAQRKEYILPKIFHVNWFRKSQQGRFLWPGFGENTRVLDWIFRRCDNEDIARESPIGLLPKEGSINLEGLQKTVDMEALFHLPKEFWEKEAAEIETYFEEQINDDLPDGIRTELRNLKERISKM